MGVTILQWNCNGLHTHSHEFRQFIAEEQYDIICLSETFLKAGKAYCFYNYNCVRQDRNDDLKCGNGKRS